VAEARTSTSNSGADRHRAISKPPDRPTVAAPRGIGLARGSSIRRLQCQLRLIVPVPRNNQATAGISLKALLNSLL
jgi:hypothetical protein